MSVPDRPAWAVHLPAGTAPSGVSLTAAGSLPAAWAATWRADPAAPVLRDVDGDWMTRGQLDARTQVVAGRLHAAGLAPGDRVLICASASADLVVAHAACLRAGLVVVPMNTAYQAREIAHIVHDADPRAAIVDRPDVAAAVRAAGPGVLVTDPAVPLADGSVPDFDTPTRDTPGMICYTSGTTGAPKGAVLSHGNLLASAEAVRIAWRWTAADRLLLCLPLFHMHGLGVGVHGTLLAGASAVLHRGFDADAVLADAADPTLGVTLFFGVPTMYARLADAPGIERLAGLRLCVAGSAPLSADLHAVIEAGTGQRVLERYGMTETVMLVSNPYDGPRRAGTVGFPLPGVELRLGARDEIEVRGPNVFSGYWRQDEATASAFTPDGWFRTGDVGAFDADGYLAIVGRTKELIISGGYNVYPREIEDVLKAHRMVADVAVVGTPSAEWGEVVTAFVVPSDPRTFDEDGLLGWASTQLAGYKRPRIVRVIDEVPRNALGKLVRAQLPVE